MLHRGTASTLRLPAANVFALQESAGELELAVGRISEGECGGRRWAQRGRQGAPWAQSAQ